MKATFDWFMNTCMYIMYVNLPTSQNLPLNPGMQKQLNPLVSIHMPALRQGEGSQELDSGVVTCAVVACSVVGVEPRSVVVTWSVVRCVVGSVTRSVVVTWSVV